MDGHIGSCKTLVDAIEQLMNGKIDVSTHKNGPDEECFRYLISQLVKKASEESNLATEYAIVCHDIKQLFEPAAGSAENKNRFSFLVANQFQLFLSLLRKNKLLYKSHADYEQHDEEIQSENDPEVVMRLDAAQKTRQKLWKFSLGLVKFLGQLHNVGFMNMTIVELCMKHFIGYCETPTELDVECFCVLMTIVGENLEKTQRGKAIVEKFLGILENVVDRQAETFVYNIRCLILDVFELRENNWIPVRPDQNNNAVPPATVNEVAEKIEAAKRSREFLKEVDETLEKLGKERLLDFMYRFMDAAMTEDQLEGSVKIIFDHAIVSPFSSMFALVCKGLSDFKASEPGNSDGSEGQTFKKHLVQLIRSEIDVIRKKSQDFRTILMRLQCLKVEKIKSKVEKLKAELESDFKIGFRAVAVAEFIGELYNACFFESCFIFDEIFIVFEDPKFTSDIAIECFCKLLKLSGTKMIREKNRDVLIKKSLLRVLEASEKISLFPKTKFIIQEAIDFSRLQLKLSVKNPTEDEVRNAKPVNIFWRSRLVKECKKSPVEIRAKKRNDKVLLDQNSNDISAISRNDELMKIFNPHVSPPTSPFAASSTSGSTFSRHNIVYENMPDFHKQLYINSNNQAQNFSPVPIDFSKNSVNSTMINNF